MIKTYNVTIKDDCDKYEIVEKLKKVSCSCLDFCENISNTMVLNLEEEHITELTDLTEVINVTEEPTPFSANLPLFFSKNKIYTAISPNVTEAGSDYSSLQFYFFNNQLESNQDVGWHPSDGTDSVEGRYVSFWTGKNVDIVTLEVNSNLNFTGYHNTHPDFDDPDNTGNTRVVPMNWPSSTGPNLQVASNNVLSKHAIGVVSSAAGTVCGFAKKASIRAAYITNIVANMNSIIQWHNTKPVNPVTNKVNPTILISEYQYLFGNRTACKIQDINSFTHLGVTTSQPPGGWGNDFTPFVNANIIPKRVRDPQDQSWHWCVVVPIQSEFIQLKAAIEAAWDAGILVINAAGNDGTVFAKNTDPSHNSTIQVSSGATIYNIDRNSSGICSITRSVLSSTQNYFLFRTFGPTGLDKSIDVAAIQNSQSFPIIEPYSVRGSGIDMTGMGSQTWTSSPVQTYSDGFQWGMFGGTSCAAPTVAGITACLMERYFYYHNSWPTPNTIKEILSNISQKNVLINNTTTTWSSVPSANSNITQSDFADGGANMLQIENGINLNGGVRLRDFAGTENKKPFVDNSVLRARYTVSDRTQDGFIYPRRDIRR